MPKDLSGVMPMMVTPFKKNGEVDVDHLRSFTEYLISNGVHGLSMVGSTGEFVHLSTKERILVTKVVIDESNGRVLTIPGVGALTTEEAIKNAKNAEDLGADAVLLPPPFYFYLSREELKGYFKEVADSIEIPVILYNAPLTTGIDLEAELVCELAETTENIRYIKESTQDITAVQKTVFLGRDKITAFAGLDHLIMPLLGVGCKGIMAASVSIVPELTVSMWNYFEKGDMKRVSEIFYRLLPLFNEITGGGSNELHFVQSNKAALNMLGVEVGAPRKPLLPLDKMSSEKLRKTLGIVIGREIPRTI